MAEPDDVTKSERKRRDFEETSRVAAEASRQSLDASREKTERLRALRLAKESNSSDGSDWARLAPRRRDPSDH